MSSAATCVHMARMAAHEAALAFKLDREAEAQWWLRQAREWLGRYRQLEQS